MVNEIDSGLRPVLSETCDKTVLNKCNDVCPVVEKKFVQNTDDLERNNHRDVGLGPIIEVWEGHATDPCIRYQGSSGGVMSALSLYAIDRAGMHGVLHVAKDNESPVNNKVVMSRTKEELLSNAGSRYAPAAVCAGLHLIESAPAPCVFIGQPSEVNALRKVQNIRPEIKRNIGLVLSFFCAGTPSSRGTLDLLSKNNISLGDVSRISYRGHGWPGMFSVWLKNKLLPDLELSYEESWGYIQSYRPWAVHMWPDGTGEHADISCGDAWHKYTDNINEGSSILVVRTEVGRRIIQQAVSDGYITLVRVGSSEVIHAQKKLISKRGAIWGRIMCMRIFGLPTPDYRAYNLFSSWLNISHYEKIRSIISTIRRIIVMKYYHPLEIGLVVKSRDC